MPVVELRAHTQHGGWQGTVSADEMDFQKVTDRLAKEKLIKAEEFLLAIVVSSNEVGEGKLFPPEMICYLGRIPEEYSDAGWGVDIARQDKRIHLLARRVTLKVDLQTIFGFFKRFEMVLTPGNMDLIGRSMNVG